jgi:hypothetical protein
MSLELNASDDFAPWVDGLECVMLRRRDAGGNVLVAAALRRRTTSQEAEPSGGAARQSDAVWHLQLSEAESAPQVGDVVIEGLVDGLIDGNVRQWTILQVEEQSLLGRWKCLTRELLVAFGWDDRVDVQRAVWGDLGEGPVIVDWDFVYTALPVRIQPDETAVTGPMDAPTSNSRFTIILGEPFPLRPDDRFVAADGMVYRLESIEQMDLIDALPIARVVRV